MVLKRFLLNILSVIYTISCHCRGYPVAQLVETLRYKPEGRGFDSRRRHWNFSLTYPSGRTMALGLAQPLTEMSTRNISWGIKATSA
jgi:hypothetical protein